jgi:glutamate-1-semialdehyde aminotransferase
MALGGAQEHFGVTADLVAFSKAMANGFSISAVTGPREIMMGLALTKISSTFFANPVDMAAAIATIGILRDTDALADVWELGTALIDGLNAVARRSGSPVEVIGYAPTPFLRYVGPPARQQRWEQAFYQATTAGGILLHPAHQWFLSAAHTPRDIDQVIEVCAAALQVADRT